MSENSKVEAAQLGSEKSKDIRQTNIIAAKGKAQMPFVLLISPPIFSVTAVADVVRTSLGPRGMDKMVSPESSFCAHTSLF